MAYASEYPPYASTEHFRQEDFVGQDQSGRRDQYPPIRGGHGASPDGSPDTHSANFNSGDYGGYEKGMNPVSRGSIAAQMAAEGQIPKKEGLRMWRADEHAGALTRGGRGRACGRICCCSIILVLIILVSIIASFLLWTRPPDVTFNGVEAPANGSEVTVQSNGFLLNFQLNIGVVNPNFFGVNFDEIKATGAYSTAPTQNLGGGTLNNVDIKKNSNTTIHFPFTINYTLSDDPTLSIAKDIVGKCGLLGGTKADLTIDYTVTLKLKVVAVSISPSFSSSTSFPCPLSESDLSGIVGSLGGSLGRRSPSPLSDSSSSPLLVDERDWDSAVQTLSRERRGVLERAVGVVMTRGMELSARSWESERRTWR